MRVVVRLAALAILAFNSFVWSRSRAQQPDAAAPKRVALLVGVNHYEKRGFIELKWPENDVDELGAELKRLSFDKVVVMKGSFAANDPLKATTRNILTQLKELLRGLGNDDVVCVALCGHGQQMTIKKQDGEFVEADFFCPTDALSEDPSTMVAINVLTDDIWPKRGGKNLLLIDACRDNPAEKRTKGIQGRAVSVPEDTAILFACRAGQKSEERDSLKHSIFMHAVIETLRTSTGPVRWATLVDQVQDRVFALNPNQWPTCAGTVEGFPIGSKVASPNPETTLALQFVTTRVGQIKMKLIPAGTFLMGSPDDDKDAGSDEKPQHRVRITRAFYLGVYEVTQGEYKAVMDANPSYFSANGGGKRRVAGQSTDRHPVEHVSWWDAIVFCNTLSAMEGRAAFYEIGKQSVTVPDWSARGYRLPTEAEWEYACWGNLPKVTRFSFGDDTARLGEFAWHLDNSDQKTHRVGEKRSNGFDLFDMHGNVAEWCWDGYSMGYYKASPVADPRGFDEAENRVYRGGGWYNGANVLRSADRNAHVPHYAVDYRGFRLARAQSVR
jgi:formylglycine-generating enzyme required for sulfatase activity